MHLGEPNRNIKAWQVASQVNYIRHCIVELTQYCTMLLAPLYPVYDVMALHDIVLHIGDNYVLRSMVPDLLHWQKSSAAYWIQILQDYIFFIPKIENLGDAEPNIWCSPHSILCNLWWLTELQWRKLIHQWKLVDITLQTIKLAWENAGDNFPFPSHSSSPTMKRPL